MWKLLNPVLYIPWLVVSANRLHSRQIMLKFTHLTQGWIVIMVEYLIHQCSMGSLLAEYIRHWAATGSRWGLILYWETDALLCLTYKQDSILSTYSYSSKVCLRVLYSWTGYPATVTLPARSQEALGEPRSAVTQAKPYLDCPRTSRRVSKSDTTRVLLVRPIIN